MHAIKWHGKINPQSFFFFFFFFNKRKLKGKQRENKVGQNAGSFTCSYLFQRKECTINIYSERIKKIKKKGQILLQKTQLSSCLKRCMVLASSIALHLNVVCCAVLPNLVLIWSLVIFGGLLRSTVEGISALVQKRSIVALREVEKNWTPKVQDQGDGNKISFSKS